MYTSRGRATAEPGAGRAERRVRYPMKPSSLTPSGHPVYSVRLSFSKARTFPVF